MSKVGAKELQRIIAASTTSAIDNSAPGSSDESIALLRDKFEQMRAMSDIDRDVIRQIQERMVEQRQETRHRQSITRALEAKFDELARVSRVDREQVQALGAALHDHADEIVKVRAEKASLATMNDALRHEMGAKREAYAAALSRMGEIEVAMSAKVAQVKELQDMIGRDRSSSVMSLEKVSTECDGLRSELDRSLDALQRASSMAPSRDRPIGGRGAAGGGREAPCQTRPAQMSCLSSGSQGEAEALQRVNNGLRREVDDLHEMADKNRQVADGVIRERDLANAACGEMRARLETARVQATEEGRAAQEAMNTTMAQLSRCAEREAKLTRNFEAALMREEAIGKENSELREDLRAARAEFQECQAANAILMQRDSEQSGMTRKVSELESQVAYFKGKIDVERGLVDQEKRKAVARQAEWDRIELENRQERRASAERVSRLCKTEGEVRKAVAQLLNAQEAMEGSFTCLACMQLLNEPVTCVPCGHVLCSDCCTGHRRCLECNQPINSITPNRNMDALGGKFTYTRQVLAKLKEEIQSSPLFAN